MKVDNTTKRRPAALVPIGYLINLANGSTTAPAYPQTLYNGSVYSVIGVEVVTKARVNLQLYQGPEFLGPQRGYMITATAHDLDSGAVPVWVQDDPGPA